MTIKNVLYVPEFECNLLSVSKITNDLQCAMTFFPNFCVMQDIRSRELIGAGECFKGLYKMAMMGTERQAMMASVNTWHKRLGHASNSKLSHVGFIKNASLKSKGVCDSCMKAKFSRLPFTISTTKTSACFELIHCDVWGKYRTPSYTQAREPITNNDASYPNINTLQDGPIFHNEVTSQENNFEGPPIETETSRESSPIGPVATTTEDRPIISEQSSFPGPTATTFEDGANISERPKRNRTKPTYLKDYDVKLPPSLDQEHSPSNSDQEPSMPKFFGQAIHNPKWVDAMKAEIQALERNKTWTLQEFPKGKRPIESKWVYKIKYKPNGDIERYKARLVAKGFTQMEGIDFHDTFSPVAKLVTVRCLLAVAVKRGWHTHQLDVNNAFLHGDLHEDIYMKVPQGFRKEGDNRVCKLNKSLYGLKQASRNWYQKFTTSLQRNNMKKIQEIKIFLDRMFSIKDLGPLKFFLGIEVARTTQGMVLSQRKYALDILEDTGMTGCRPSPFPMEQHLKLDKQEQEDRVDANQYRRLVGRLLYLQATRPDIAYSVNILSQFVHDPKVSHLKAATRILRYLKATPGQGILLSKDGGTNLTAYCDSDWLGCPMTRRSRTGYLLLLGGTPISWKSKKQLVVSRSSAEAEYRAMASTVSEVLWLRWLLRELEISCPDPTQLFCDNQAARHIANNPVFHERTKHVEMDCCFVRERVEAKEILPMAINTKDQIADVFTKPLGTQNLQALLGKLGIINLHAPT
ncbi:putative RNA-directed DNA polymerase [Helianthus annuus]|nr:putative RNA-directed DNA polymerase [Helianthus annuus]